jgi:molybdate transport system substrate-binding protein
VTRAAALALLLAAAAALAGCGASKGELRVSAASSLKTALTAYGKESGARFSFAGSDELAAQIRRGARPDVFASANTKLPEELFRAGLVERPVAFAVNRLVLAVPAGSRRVRSLDDLRRPGTALAVGAESVPIGAYTREVLSRLPEAESSAIVANVRSEEPDVSGIVGKLTQGAVDAGFVYASDVRAAGGRLRAVALPDSLQPQVTYGVTIVKNTERGEEAKAFVDGLLEGPGRRTLAAAGFDPPPDATQ